MFTACLLYGMLLITVCYSNEISLRNRARRKRVPNMNLKITINFLFYVFRLHSFLCSISSSHSHKCHKLFAIAWIYWFNSQIFIVIRKQNAGLFFPKINKMNRPRAVRKFPIQLNSTVLSRRTLKWFFSSSSNQIEHLPSTVHETNKQTSRRRTFSRDTERMFDWLAIERYSLSDNRRWLLPIIWWKCCYLSFTLLALYFD